MPVTSKEWHNSAPESKLRKISAGGAYSVIFQDFINIRGGQQLFGGGGLRVFRLQLPVDADVLEQEALCIGQGVGNLAAVERDVFQHDIADRMSLYAHGIDAAFVGTAALDVADAEVLEEGRVEAAPSAVVVVLETNQGRADVLHGDVVYGDIADEAAPVQVGFEVDGRMAVAYADIVHMDVLDAGGHLAADTEAIALGPEIAVPDDDARGLLPDSPGILVAACLDGDSVVSCLEGAFFNQDVRRVLRIAAVVVLVVTLDGDATDGDIIAKEGVDNPVGAVDDGKVLDEHVLAAEGLDHIRRHNGRRAEVPFPHGDKVDTHLSQAVLLCRALGTHSGEGLLCVAIEDASAGKGDVVAVVRADKGSIIIHFRPFPNGQLSGKIIQGIVAEDQFAPFRDTKIDIAFEIDAAFTENLAERKHYGSAAFIAAAGDGFVDGAAAVGRAVRYGAEICRRVFDGPKLRGMNIGQNGFDGRGFLISAGNPQEGQQGIQNSFHIQ